MKDLNLELVDTMERLIDSTEKLADRLTEQSEQRVTNITATLDHDREADLLRRLEEAEAKIAEANGKIAELSAAATAAANAPTGRKTTAVGTMVARHGEASLDTHALDTALSSLSIEQRLAVKAELLRSGAIA